MDHTFAKVHFGLREPAGHQLTIVYSVIHCIIASYEIISVHFVAVACQLKNWIFNTPQMSSQCTAIFGHAADSTNPPWHTLLFDITSTYHSTNSQIVHGVVARVVPASSGQINFATPLTMHSVIYGEVLFTVVSISVVKTKPLAAVSRNSSRYYTQ